MSEQSERAIAKKYVKAKKEIKAKGGEYETGYYIGRILSFVFGTIQLLGPIAMVIFLMWLIPQAFPNMSGHVVVAISIGIPIATMYFTDWGASWIEHHKKLYRRIKGKTEAKS